MDDAFRAVLASAEILDEDSVVRASAQTTLDQLLDNQDNTIAKNAAIVLLRDSDDDPHTSRVARAEAILRPEHRFLVAIFGAVRHLKRGQPQSAERLLLPYAEREDALKLLVDCAAVQEHWGKAADRSRALVTLTGDAQDRLKWGHALTMSGRQGDAIEQFRAVARDHRVSDVLRDSAFGSLLAIVDRRDFAGLAALSAEWFEAVPSSTGARWNLAYAHMRLGRVEDAYALIGAELDPDKLSVDQARLLAEVVVRRLPAVEALPRIIALSDHFERDVETLELAVVHAGLGAGSTQLPEVLGNRIKDTMGTFNQRFPESHALRTFKVPETGEGFVEMLREMQGDRPERIRDANVQVAAGRAPVALLSALAGRECLETWSRLSELPLGFLLPDLEDLEDQAAAAAIGGAVVWDSSSLYVLACLPDDIREAIFLTFPGSVVAIDVLEDAIAADTHLGDETAYVGADENGRGWWHEPSDAERAQRHARLSIARTAAQGFVARVGQAAPEHGEWAQLLEDRPHDRRTPLDAIATTFLVAMAEERPVYSDDRWVRQAARKEGVAAFGTLGLLAVLHEHGLVDAAGHERARRALAAEQAWGVGLTGFELLRAARDVDFAATGAVAGALSDRAAWAQARETMWLALIDLLVEADQHHDTAPEGLLRAAADGYRATYSDECPPTEALEVAIALSWLDREDRDPVPQSCFQTIVRTARTYAAELDTPVLDPLLGAVRRLLDNGVPHLEPPQRSAFVRHLAMRLDQDDQRLVADFVFGSETATPQEPSPPHGAA